MEAEINDWIYNLDSKPSCYRSGKWDGKQSDKVLVQLKDDSYVIATCYEGHMDGSYFYDWYYTQQEYELNESDIYRWMNIPH